MFASWKTTLGGVGMILTGLATLVSGLAEGGLAGVEWEVVVGAITGGAGLLLARDNNKSSEDVHAK